MTFGMIGTGNMAWFLAQRLTMSGHRCMAVWGRDPQSAAALADAVNSQAVAAPEELRYTKSDALILAVSDAAIAPLAATLASSDPCVLIHTAGAVDLEALAPAPHRGVIWPVYSILKQNIPRHREIPCAIEAGTGHARQLTENLAHSFSDRVFAADIDQRRWLHLAAVMGNNFINHLMAITEAICARQQLPFDVLEPILRQTFERTATAAPSTLQTGPAARHDAVTIKKHLALLAGDPVWAEVYRALTASIQRSTRVEGN
jgi:predicted short-subunit dehydrogenase-like oxidoreductase (DUF2520 family)